MRKQFGYLILMCGVVAGAGAVWFATSRSIVTVDDYRSVSRTPRIKPDYTETVIPPNIAPLNFAVLEPGTGYLVEIHSVTGKSIHIFSREGVIKISPRKWRSLLNANRGRKLSFDVYVKNEEGRWSRYEAITNTVAKENVDSYLAYRLMRPIYNNVMDVGIYQRKLEDYGESEILHSRHSGCINCHTFLNNTPEQMTIGVRSSDYGSSTLLASDGKVRKIGEKWGYTTWHPSGRLAVYSVNKVRQFFHVDPPEFRDVLDLDSAINYYMLDSHKIKTIKEISKKDQLETYPTWSPDGRYLYYCNAPILWTDRETVPPKRYKEVKYDLMRVSYDVETDEWGQPETVLSAEETGKSMLCPRISPDGRFLIFCMCDYSCAPAYQLNSDLYVIELETGQYRKLPINSEFSESWHSFSSNGRWLAFSSKRLGGFFTRTYFSYIDKDGKAYKPFILPQKDPLYYDSLLQTYSVPELIKSPVKVSQISLARAVRGTEKIKIDGLSSATKKAEDSAWKYVRE